jgi:hypothetical protein
VTTRTPHDDYLPNISPNQYGTLSFQAPYSVPVQNSLAAGGANNAQEHCATIPGLININTAPAKILSMLPMLPEGSDSFKFDPVTGGLTVGPNQLPDNIDLAEAIVLWRDGDGSATHPAHGPFTSIYDLYKVPAFKVAQSHLLAAGDPDDAQGDYSPVDTTGTGAATPDNVRFDFEEEFLLLSRISSLITTRSDSYTVYVLVQGWSGVGTSNPQLVVQRRAAFVADRSQVVPTDANVTSLNIPSD